MQQNILPEASQDLKVYVVWFEMLGGDSREQWPNDVLVDERVTHVWDDDRAVGQWLAQKQNSGLDYNGPIVWDAYLTLAPGTRWGDRLEPDGAGWTVIGKTEQLERDVQRAEAA